MTAAAAGPDERRLKRLREMYADECAGKALFTGLAAHKFGRLDGVHGVDGVDGHLLRHGTRASGWRRRW